jgi:hypothetical protein
VLFDPLADGSFLIVNSLFYFLPPVADFPITEPVEASGLLFAFNVEIVYLYFLYKQNNIELLNSNAKSELNTFFIRNNLYIGIKIFNLFNMNTFLQKLLTSFLLICTIGAYAQQAPAPSISPVDSLIKYYSGTATWNSTTKTVTFTSTGVITFPNRVEKTDNIWHIPASVSKVFINANVQVTGQFTWGHVMTFEGADKNTSVVFGTPSQGVLNKAGLDKKYTCVAYSTFYGYGTGDNYIKNLTTLNPLGFMFTGKGNCRLHLDHVRGIDNRGGWGNHSDGISAASGSTVKNCYLETGDDAIKVYANILVEDTEIKMVQNCVPIQYTWGTYGSGAVGTFKRVKITGSHGRGSEKQIIDVASSNVGANYTKTIIMDSCTFDNPNATLIRFTDNNVNSTITITNSKINVKAYGAKYGKGVVTICGQVTPRTNIYDCLTATSIKDVEPSVKDLDVYPNPFNNEIYVQTNSKNIELFSLTGSKLSVEINAVAKAYVIDASMLTKGVYLLKVDGEIKKLIKN